MAFLLQRVASQAQTTFSMSLTDESFPDSLTQLVNLINKLRVSDLNVIPRFIRNEVHAETGNLFPDVIGFDIETNQVFSMNLFIIRGDCKLTLHNHSNMHGILKTICGSVKLTSYTVATEPVNEAVTPEDAREIRQPNCLIPVELCMSADLTSKDMPVVFTPTEGNFHEIRAVGSDAMIFDILSPSYGVAQSSRNFYRVIETISSNKKKIWLHKILPSFSSVKAKYRGHKISL